MNGSEPADTVARFNARACDYALYRPSYPAEAIDAILHGLKGPSGLDAVDVGAGTGISARLLAERGCRVVGIEPNDEMRAAAADLDVRPGRADATGLPDACADLVTSFQAFHWFANSESVAEFLRILRARGRIALVWNERDDADPFTNDYGEIVDGFANRFVLAGFQNGPELVMRLLARGGLHGVRRESFSNRQRLDYEGLMGRVRSTSYAPREGPMHASMIAKLDASFAHHQRDRAIDLVYRTDVYLADKGP